RDAIATAGIEHAHTVAHVSRNRLDLELLRDEILRAGGQPKPRPTVPERVDGLRGAGLLAHCWVLSSRHSRFRHREVRPRPAATPRRVVASARISRAAR